MLRAVRDGVAGYPVDGYTPELAEAYAGFAHRHYASSVEPEWVTPGRRRHRGSPARARRALRGRPGGLPGAGLLAAARHRRASPDASGSTSSSTRTRPAPRSTSTGSTRCSPRGPDAAADPAAQPVGPGLHPAGARGHPRRRDPARGTGRLRRDPRAAGAAGREPHVVPRPAGHPRARGRGGGGLQGVQHRRAPLRPARGPGRGRPADARRPADVAQRLVVTARGRGRGRGVHRRRPVAGLARRAARPAPDAARASS